VNEDKNAGPNEKIDLIEKIELEKADLSEVDSSEPGG